MRHSRPAVRIATLAIKPTTSRFLALFLYATAGALLIWGKNQNNSIESISQEVSGTIAPVVSTLARPLDAIANATQWVQEMAVLHSDNLQLKQERDRLLHWQTTANELSAENSRLRELLKAVPSRPSPYISARLALDASNPYTHSVIVDAGIEHGVDENAAVISSAGLVGRILEAGKATSRLLLLSDINSRIPVVTEKSREHAIAGGNGSELISLLYLPDNTKVRAGETVVTSGDGHVLPAGLPVGIVKTGPKGELLVEPYVDWHRLEWVTVLGASK